MANMIKIEKEKLIKIIELARQNRGINVNDLLSLASIKLDPEEETKDEADKKSKQRELKTWTKSEEKHFIDLIQNGTNYLDIANKLGRSLGSVYNKAHQLRVAGHLLKDKRYPNSNNAYDEEEDALLIDTFTRYQEITDIPDIWIERIAEAVGRTKEAIVTRMYILKKGLE